MLAFAGITGYGLLLTAGECLCRQGGAGTALALPFLCNFCHENSKFQRAHYALAGLNAELDLRWH